MRGSRPWLIPAALFAGAALIAGFTILRGVDSFDEGVVLSAARRVAGGEVPYSDFLWSYGPAQPYLLAGLAELLGASLLHWRVLWVLAAAGVALIAFLLVRRHAGTRWALVAWLLAALAMAHPRSPNPFPFALLGALAALLVADGGGSPERRAGWAGLLLAATAAFRLDFAIYGAAAVLVLLAVETRRARPALVCAAVAVAGTALVYLPFAIAAGPADLYEVVVGKSLRERDYWTLEFPWSFDAPALALPGLVVVGAAGVLRAARERTLPAPWAGMAVFGLGTVSYLLSRADPPHAIPLVVTLAILLPLVAAWALRDGPPIGPLLAAAAVAALALLLVEAAGPRASALLNPPPSLPIDAAAADGVTERPERARSINRAVALVRAQVPPGRPFYSAPGRADLIPLTDPLLYVLADRDNATDRDVDLLSRAPVQRRIVAQLERARPRVVVRWMLPLRWPREDNLQGRSSGVRLLDRWIDRNYRSAERLRDYDVLVIR